MTAKKPEARVKEVTREYDGFLSIDKYKIEKDLHEGGTAEITWLVMERGHAVGVLAYDPEEDKVVLINEMRPGILADGAYPYTDTVPAGGMSKGESAIVAAVREMGEETGLELKNARVIHERSYVSSGGTSEAITLVFGIVAAKKAGGIHGLESESENIKTVVLSAQEFFDRIENDSITDMKTQLAGYWLEKNRDKIRAEFAQQKKPAAGKGGSLAP
ncbi:MAG: NUDIX domain-containing protein [Alphaproteobacteria bacterium]|nr:NUDIX domain-containing protein [Alphaproteobacteria bacterium]